MGFWQNLVDSYDKNADVLRKIYPLSTTSISNNSDMIVVIVIDGNGKFIRVDKIEKKSKPSKKGPGNPLVNITIPVTEESMGRSSGISPHPVFDQYEYLKGMTGKSDEHIKRFYCHCDHIRQYLKKLNTNKKASETRLKKWKNYETRIKRTETCGKKYDAYIQQLKDFAESPFATESVEAIYWYVKAGTIASNLSIIEMKDTTNIIFQVEPQLKVWEDEAFFSAWHQYYLGEKAMRAEKKQSAEKKISSKTKLSKDEKKQLKEQTELKDAVELDYITGREQQPIAIFHPKKISNASANAKLVSDNDKTNYTFRGKFEDSSQAVSIGYETSQKAHQFLRYLINDRGYYCGEQVILSFAIDSSENLLPLPIEEKSIWSVLQESQLKTEHDKRIDLRAETGIDYANALKKALNGFGFSKTLEKHAKTVVVALNAATTGRLSITFYRELVQTEYLEKIADWHEGCKWHQKFWDKEREVFVPYLGAPSVDTVIEAVYGKPRGKDESYTKIKKAARERLLRCIFDGAFLPMDYVAAAVRRASNPLGITKNNKFDHSGFDRIISTACALIRKDYKQRNKEDYKVSIELDRNDRDYLYGRLLGAADKLEEYALHKQGKDRVVTAAIRHMQAFAQHPFRTWQTIHSCLNPYIQKVKGSFAFNEIEEVKQLFMSREYEKDTPLNGAYLIGYYHERAYIDRLIKEASDKKKLNNDNEKEKSNDKQ